MNAALVKVKGVTLTIKPAKLRGPKGVGITLSLCDCYRQEKLILVTKRAESIATLLGITLEQLECFAVTAMLTSRPVVVACYKQRDLAETKLIQIKALTPFIWKACHSFRLLSKD